MKKLPIALMSVVVLLLATSVTPAGAAGTLPLVPCPGFLIHFPNPNCISGPPAIAPGGGPGRGAARPVFRRPPPPPRPPSVATVAARAGVPVPTITFNPDPSGLTGLSTILSAAPTAAIPINQGYPRGVTVTGTLVAEKFAWDVTDGTKIVPLSGPNPEHIYDTRGASRVTLTVTWRCRGCRAAGAVPATVAGTVTRTAPVAIYPVKEARAVLR